MGMLEVVHGSVLDVLLQLAGGPSPNIRFNVAKALEKLATQVGDTSDGRALVRIKVAPVFEALENGPGRRYHVLRFTCAKEAQALQA